MDQRIDIATNPSALTEFTELARSGINSDRGLALDWLARSKYFITADALFTAAGGDEPSSAVKNERLGTRWTRGESFLAYAHKAYRGQTWPTTLVDGPHHHFDGRPPTPSRRLSDDARAAYQLRHFDMMSELDEAMQVVIDAGIQLHETEATPELRDFVAANVRAGQRQHFTWTAK